MVNSDEYWDGVINYVSMMDTPLSLYIYIYIKTSTENEWKKNDTFPFWPTKRPETPTKLIIKFKCIAFHNSMHILYIYL